MALPQDFYARLSACQGNPSAFSQLIFGTPLHAGQARYALNATHDVNFLLPGNSFGKTELIMRLAIYLAWFKDGEYRPSTADEWLTQEYKILIASYNYPIAKESHDRFLNHYRTSEALRALVTHHTISDPPRVILSNGSVIDWGSLDGEGKLVEAARRRHIFVDEAGHIPDLAYTFDNILYPRTIGVGGRIHLFGTPKPHSDPYLLEVYAKGRDGLDPFYYSQAGSSLENEFWPEPEKRRLLANPRYVKGWDACKDKECTYVLCQKKLHPQLTPMGRQVIMGEFILAGGYFFSRPHVDRIFTGSTETWDSYGAIEPRPGRLYLGAFDLAGNKLRRKTTKNKGSDPTVGFVIDFTDRPWQLVWFQHIEGGEMDWNQKYERMTTVYKRYSMPYLLIDATGQVDSVSEALQERGVEVEGVHFGGVTSKKYDMLRNLQLCMELDWGGSKGVLRSPLIPRLKHELYHYLLPDDDIQQDCVMALAMLTHHIAQQELPAPVTGDVY